MATMKDVALRAGVSTTTVSHIINDTRYVSEDLRRKVMDAIAALNYQPHGPARSLRTKRTRTIGMIIPDNSNPFFAEVARSVEDAAFDNQYNVILCNSDGSPVKELNYLHLLIEKGVDGLAFISAGKDPRSIDLLSQQSIPWVVADREIPKVKADEVLVDNLDGGLQATHYLLSLGHRRIGCIAGPRQLTPSFERLTGYQRALAAAGIAVDPEMIRHGDFRSSSGYDACQALMRHREPPSAIFACNDLMAIGALKAAHDSGLGIPQQLSIIGFDDIAWSAFTFPRLTTMAQPKQEMGRLLTAWLVERIKNDQLPQRRRMLAAKLMVRDSCAPLETAWVRQGHP
ncbi:MAG: LacI family DNA-binding transcriptional regulator [Desulfosarcinaceae bacterium]|nr:LacI family DNA-binding transcriptional regulator [Desulfosarcinaceae bacterium]